jgi:ABC-2 type transport system ATP-binding protein
MEELTATQYKHVKVTLDGDFSLPGAENLKRRNGTLEFLYKGSADALLTALAARHVNNVLIEDPPLEDIFMTYYREGGK